MRKSFITLLLAMLFGGMAADGLAAKTKPESEKESDKTEKADSTSEKKETYKDLLKDAKTYDGLFKVHEVKDKYYFEIPKNILTRDYLLASRVTSISNNKDISAGQMPRNPLLITFSADKNNVYIHMKGTTMECDTTSNMYQSFLRNYEDPIWQAYKIEAMAPDSSAYVIDITDLFLGDVPELSPFRNASIVDVLLKRKPLTGSLSSSKSAILKVSNFPQNINIKSRMTYNADGPFTAVLTRNIILLPEEPMPVRLADERIGYFSELRRRYTETEDGIDEYRIINRWDLRPRPEDVERHRRGELVEPAKPIVYYVDPAIPDKWRGYIKQGIEDWQPAFEAIGFKDAIVARDYPEDDPEFDPDDIRYSCYRMITTPVENSMGPSWIDPRSGEIIQGDVLFYSNVVSILHTWRFVQTGAVDPSVRKATLDDDVMGALLRNVAAHEIGHTLGLQHNFGASYSYPVDSLRSATFTQKYGTTPSIMDYTRYNYVAQPEDKGVRLTPPDLGVYDMHAIKWGYKPIYDAATPEDEKATLDRWIAEKAGDPMYKFGPQPFINEFDPSCKSEDLGNDAVLASEYGVKNLKVIMKNLNEWTDDDDSDYERLADAYAGVWMQLQQYLLHVSVSLGGIYAETPVRGDGRKIIRFASKDEQKRSLDFLMNTLKELPEWLEEPTVTDYIGPLYSVSTLQGIMIERMFFNSISSSQVLFEEQDPENAYRYSDFMDDLYNHIWEKTLEGKNPDRYDRNMQITYIDKLIEVNGLAKRARASLFFADPSGLYDKRLYEDPGYVSMYGNAITYEPNTLVDIKVYKDPIYYKKLMDTCKLLKKAQNRGSRDARLHYRTLLFRLERMMETKE